MSLPNIHFFLPIFCSLQITYYLCNYQLSTIKMDTLATQKIGFWKAVKTCMCEKFATAKGRATRPEFWFFVLFQTLLLLVICIILCAITAILALKEDIILGLSLYGACLIVFTLIFLIPNICASIRRLHDTGHTGWWCLLNLLPYVGTIILLLMLCLESQPKDNEYGHYVVNS